MQKLISNREMFRQLLARDILNIIDEWNNGNFVRLCDIRLELQKGMAIKHYYNLHTSKGWSYLCFNDRFYRAIQSINNKGYGITVRKHTDGKLFVFSTKSMQKDFMQQFIADSFTDWDTCYSNNTGYNINTQLDEAEAMNVIDVA